MGGLILMQIEIDNALKELHYALIHPLKCKDFHSQEYIHSVSQSEHTNLHIDRAIKILEGSQ